ncbi:cytochrome P450 9e2-like [Cloeon dipterum]|uniref:cytochrome P450 9e2-like n=1 Tax=Cloeon dipterum TaxID=197152 RepID=UPI00321FD887
MGWILTMLGAAVVAIVLSLLYIVLKINGSHKYWQRKKVYTLKNNTPILGHFGPLMLKKKSFCQLIYDFYQDVKQEDVAFGGTYQFQRPGLVVSSPKLISEITIKQFENFMNRRPFVDQKVDRMLGRSLLGLQDEEWREMRHHLSPAFTGSKLRGMSGLIESTCDKFNEFLAKRADQADEPLDIYNSFRRLAADLIATIAFGAPSDSISDPESEFYKNGLTITDFSGKRAPVMMGFLLVPSLMKWLGIPFIQQRLTDFFTSKIFGVIKYREENNKTRADMIQLLLDVRSGDQKKDISNMDITSQAFSFFLGGFDTMATAFSFVSHSLALHPEVQEKVREEVKEVLSKHNNKMDYEATKELLYMDMVISEVLRLYPVAPMTDRLCGSTVSFPEFDLTIEKGTSVTIPVYGLHTDPDYFPDPFKFDPERFTEENKKNIKSFTYLPFGEGPRNCIGKRFALLELKIGLSKILNEYQLEVCEKTNVTNPMVYTTSSSLVQPEGGFWLNVKPLNKQ